MYENEINAALDSTLDESDEDVARRLIATMGRKEQMIWLVRLVTREVEWHRRAQTRHVESRGFTALFEAGVSKAPAAKISTASVDDDVSSDDFRALFRQRFALGDGVRVGWGEATVDQHRQRIAMLRGLQNGIELTITRHEKAIEMIEKSKATCLDDLVKHPSLV